MKKGQLFCWKSGKKMDLISARNEPVILKSGPLLLMQHRMANWTFLEPDDHFVTQVSVKSGPFFSTLRTGWTFSLPDVLSVTQEVSKKWTL